MKLEKKWLPVLSLGLGFPSMILSLGILTDYLVTKKVVSPLLGYSVFFIVITYILGMITFYAFKRKN